MFNLEDLPKTAKEHIMKLERVRRDFVANVSHELRTPLTVIHGFLETLIQKNEKTLDPYKKIFTQMYKHSIRMEHIVDDLLLLSRLENEDRPLEEKTGINVPKILKTLCSDAQRISGNKQHIINFQTNSRLRINGSEEELKSLFSNLVINAIKYTPKKGNIIITWCLEKNHALFTVSDTGIGISKRHIPRITERFYRVSKARSRESGGTGLGLAIAKHVLMRHQGELSINSTLGKGSTFICKFPPNRTIVIKSS